MSIKFIRLANNTLIVWHSSFKIKSVDKVPVPAIIGNANGTIEEEFASVSVLKMEIFRHISNPRRNKIILPAIIKELISIENKSKIACPKNKKVTMIIPATVAVFLAWIYPILFLILIIIAVQPSTSITANSIKKAVRNFLTSSDVKNE
jgi:sensor histidine kinase YesM